MPTEGSGVPAAENQSWMPNGLDPTVPSAARVYDYWLDGARNFAADREIARKVLEIVPAAREAARVNRAFLRRAVSFMVDSGIRQFLDIGAGTPTVGNVHEIAQRADPECRIVYVDKEPIVHRDLGSAGHNQVAVIQANLRDVEDILSHPQTQRLLDLDQPIGLLMLWVLHFVPDSWDLEGIMTRYRDRLAPGSHLAISHVTADSRPPWVDEIVQLYRSTPDPVCFRSHTEVLRYFAGFELVEPGLVGSAFWRASGPGDVSDDVEMNSVSYGGVGCKL